jgi:nickel transport protein
MRNLLLAALVVLFAASPASAHRLKVFAATIGDELQGRVYFVGGGPATGVPVTLRDAGNAVLAETTSTSPDGRFVLPLARAEALTITADAEDGHVATFTIRAGQSAAPSAAAPQAIAAQADADAAFDAALARQLAPLTDEINALRDSLGLRDILGGLGYLLGAFGLWALYLARQRK